MQVETPSNLVFTEIPVSPTNLTRRKADVARSRNNGSQRRKPARRLRSSSRKDASRVQSIMLPSANKTRSTRRSRANALQDRSLRRSKRIMKSSDDSEGQDADSLAFVSNDSIEESDSGVMTMDSDTRSINDDSTIDSGTKPVGAEPPENNEGETEVSDRLDFQSNTTVIKKKRKPNRKRHNSDTVEAAKLDAVASDAEVLKNDSKRYKSDSVEASKLDVVASDAEVLKNDCVSPSSSENPAQRYAKDDGDEHLPLVKRARVRMGRPSPAEEEKVTSVHKEEKMFEVPETLGMQSSESLSCKVGSPCEKESVCTEKDQSHMSPTKKPHVWEIKKNFVDEEATLPPSKRLHRALEAMSANVAEDCQVASNSSPATNILSNGHCPPVLECSELSMENKAVTELATGAVEGLSNGDFLLGASEFCTVSNVETAENDAKTMVVASDCGRAHSNDNTIPELCKGSSEHEEGTDGKGPKGSTINEVPAEIDDCTDSKSPKRSTISEVPAEIDAERHVGELALNCNMPSPIVCPTDHCKADLSELHGAAKGSDSDVLQMASVVGETGGGCSPNIDNICVPPDTVDGESDKIHKMKHLQSADKDKDSKRSEFVEASQPASLDSNSLVAVTTVKDLDSGDRRSLLHSSSTSFDHADDRTVSVTQSSSSLTDGPESVARASPPSSSVCNVSVSDNYSMENNSSCSPDVQLHLEKAKLASKSGSKGESLSSFEAIIRSLTRTKESIGRATRIAIDCAKSGFATKVVEIIARNLESESSLHKKVDLFFLVDSITQCSRGMKGDGGIYPSAIQALLPRLLLAAAPPGCSSHENHRQCLKVLRVWQERKIIPEPIIRHHIRELDALCGTYPSVGSRRPLRNERAFDDPIREMEGMQVDEYGSNSSIQLPGFCMPPMLREDDDGSDSDGESFEAVTPEHSVENFDGEKNQVPAIEKRSHILEDVDGELEMEDVAPCCEVEITSTSKIAGADLTQMSRHQSDNHYRTSALSPPPPHPPHPHPLPPSGFPPAVLNSVSNGSDSKPYSSSQQQNFNSNLHQPVLPRTKTTTMDGVHHCVHHAKDFEAQVPRHMPESSSDCSFGDRPVSRLSGRASNSGQPTDAFSKGFHVRPPHPAPTNQFSYVQEQRIQARRDIPPPSHPNRFHTRNAENGNFYRDRDRNKYVPRDNIGECWRPPYTSISGPCYPDGDGMTREPMSYGGPPREPPNNRWNFPPRPMNHRHFNPYRPPSEGPIPVANRGPNYWRPR
ncbi:hypothetical protein CDL12_09144 [Handroanthus impetiginosus]|uniref:CID domain-containing protein n=1 Tax=Handroanthus impetiginosus TaxID=429701 RepID=A0A2G9HKW6_9LAMI|nr:hypothetical protein CDL12_09144 [Handroanthus impetiginosus]